MGLNSTDLAAAEQQDGSQAPADQDFAAAEKSLDDLAQTAQLGNKGYRDLLGQLAKQHVSMLETAGNAKRRSRYSANSPSEGCPGTAFRTIFLTGIP